METRTQTVRFNTEFESSDQVTVEASDNYEALFVPFNVGGGVFIPAGRLQLPATRTVSYTLGQQRRFTGTVAVQAGEFYDGTITALDLSSARYSILKQFSVEPSISLNRIELPYGEFTTRLFRARTDYAFSPRMFAERAAPVRLGRQHLQQQRPLPLGVHPRQRVLPGLDRRARHPRRTAPACATGRSW